MTKKNAEGQIIAALQDHSKLGMKDGLEKEDKNQRKEGKIKQQDRVTTTSD